MTTYKDTDLREALRRKYANTPKLPADFMRETFSQPLPRRKGRTTILRWMAAAACLLIIISLGVTLMPKKESHDVVMPRKTTVIQKETKTDAPQPETKVAEVPKAVAVAKSKTIRQSKKKATPIQTASIELRDSSKATDVSESEKQRSPAEGKGNLITHNSSPRNDSSPFTLHSSLKPAVLTERDIPITRPENYHYTPEEIALLKKQADDAYVKWVQLELEIAKYNLEQTAQQ